MPANRSEELLRFANLPKLHSATIGIVVLLLFGVPSAIYVKHSNAEEASKVARRAVKQESLEAAWTYFQKRCKEHAGENVTRTVEGVFGMYVMKPRRQATTAELADQYWMGDPYGYDGSDGFKSLLYKGKYKFVELPVIREKGPASEIHERYMYETTGKETGFFGSSNERTTRDRTAIVGRRTESRQSMYGFTWEDISTPEDRQHWVAGGRIKVVDLRTNETIAEHTGFLIESGRGNVNVRRPWEAARVPRNVCPKQDFIPYNFDPKIKFLTRVLRPAKG